MKTRKCTLVGELDIMFSKYGGDVTMPPEDRLYVDVDGTLYVPGGNVGSMLYFAGDRAMNFKRVKATKSELNSVAPSVIQILPARIPLLGVNKKPIVFDKTFPEGGQVYVDVRKAGGSGQGGNQKLPPHMEARPVVRLPWSLDLRVGLIDNPFMDWRELEWWFEAAGGLCGLGAGRKVGFGRFSVMWGELS